MSFFVEGIEDGVWHEYMSGDKSYTKGPEKSVMGHRGTIALNYHKMRT